MLYKVAWFIAQSHNLAQHQHEKRILSPILGQDFGLTKHVLRIHVDVVQGCVIFLVSHPTLYNINMKNAFLSLILGLKCVFHVDVVQGCVIFW